MTAHEFSDTVWSAVNKLDLFNRWINEVWGDSSRSPNAKIGPYYVWIVYYAGARYLSYAILDGERIVAESRLSDGVVLHEWVREPSAQALIKLRLYA